MVFLTEQLNKLQQDDEFDAVKAMAAAARDHNQALEARIAVLEAKAKAKPKPGPKADGPVDGGTI